MARFLAGFVTASLLWGAVAGLYWNGMLEVGSADEAAAAPDAGVEAAVEDTTRRGRRGRRARRARRVRGPAQKPTGTATTGDDLGADDPRKLDMAGTGGEQQLPASAIEQGFDQAFGRIRRCLVLVAGDEPVTGKLVFGLRIEPSGEVSRVNLTGPAAATTGEAGSCLRNAARAIRFATFDGPPMIAKYPVTLE